MNHKFPFVANASIQQETGHVKFLPYVNRVVRVHQIDRLPHSVLRLHPKGNNPSNQSQNWHTASNLRHHLVPFYQPFSHLPPVGQPIRPHTCVSTSLQEHTDSILLHLDQVSSFDEVIQAQQLSAQDLQLMRGKSLPLRRYQSY